MRAFADGRHGGLSLLGGPLMISLLLVLLVLLVLLLRDADRVAGVPARAPLAGMAPGRGRDPVAGADAWAGT